MGWMPSSTHKVAWLIDERSKAPDQGEAAVRSDGLYPDTQQYVAGIQALAARFA